MGLGEFKFGSVTRDIGQGRRVYRKKQVRMGPFSLTSLVWKRKGKKAGKPADSPGDTTETSKKKAAKKPSTRSATKRTRSTEASSRKRVVKSEENMPEPPDSPGETRSKVRSSPPRSRKKKEDP